MLPGRLSLPLAAVALTAGLAIVAHSRWIETSGVSVPVDFSEASSGRAEFHPHWSRTHFVLLRLANRDHSEQNACVDSTGFALRSLDFAWSIDDGTHIVASGRHMQERWRISNPTERVAILGAFPASMHRNYTLRYHVQDTCPQLTALDPLVQVGLRPGPPLWGYQLAGVGLMFVGLVFLVLFVAREDKSWPWSIVIRWAARSQMHGR